MHLPGHRAVLESSLTDDGETSTKVPVKPGYTVRPAARRGSRWGGQNANIRHCPASI